MTSAAEHRYLEALGKQRAQIEKYRTVLSDLADLGCERGIEATCDLYDPDRDVWCVSCIARVTIEEEDKTL